MKHDKPEVEVLLSTYNGARFLEEQLDSILAQEGVSATITVRDDGSRDDSPDILRRFAGKLPERIRILSEVSGNLGVVRSYESLLGAASRPYLAFADQDDVWPRDKLLRAVRELREIEGEPAKPAMVYSDLRLVDENLQPMADSFYDYSGLRGERAMSLRQLSVQNAVVGCSAVFNSALARSALPFPPTCLMHDWWLALFAAYRGTIKLIPSCGQAYRQHGNNAVGAVTMIQAYKRRKTRRLSTFDAVEQAASLLDQTEEGDPQDVEFLSGLRKKSTFALKLHLLRHGVHKDGALRDAYFYLFERMTR